ncbi:helix-turn-helix domain-containing protein [Myroides sp. C8-3]|uniref:helix-turn-helix domain-containing protein n=1 Tax=Myroides sp. C8-3 TaxID=3400533 RepID=UPI003D2F8772
MIRTFEKDYKALGSKIKKRRIELNIGQKELAEMTFPKIDRSKISDLENGKEDFYFSTLLRICKALDISLIDLMKNY